MGAISSVGCNIEYSRLYSTDRSMGGSYASLADKRAIKSEDTTLLDSENTEYITDRIESRNQQTLSTLSVLEEDEMADSFITFQDSTARKRKK